MPVFLLLGELKKELFILYIKVNTEKGNKSHGNKENMSTKFVVQNNIIKHKKERRRSDGPHVDGVVSLVFLVELRGELDEVSDRKVPPLVGILI